MGKPSLAMRHSGQLVDTFAVQWLDGLAVLRIARLCGAYFLQITKPGGDGPGAPADTAWEIEPSPRKCVGRRLRHWRPSHERK